ncbi:MAG: hypothetical protein JXP34_04100 [Planctomycetes bacterium]|nr:hypothetical protein [Planctomycetota bacterium]
MSILVAWIVLSAPSGTEFARQSRSCFSGMIDFKVRSGDLEIVRSGTGSISASTSLLRSHFPGVGRFQFRTEHGSSSSSGGGSGSVAVEIESGGVAGSYGFHLVSPDGEETIDLVQTAPGALEFTLKGPDGRVRYTQRKGRCRLFAARKGVAGSVGGSTFVELLSMSGEVGGVLIDVLESYFDRVPAERPAPVPRDGVLFVLDDGTSIVGKPAGDAIHLRTAYGILTIPYEEVREVVVPAPAAAGKTPEGEDEVIVIARRFTATGSLEERSFEVDTKYGAFRPEIDAIRRIFFGGGGG